MNFYFQVEESMKNLETVVRERNKAYYQLETGQDGEQPVHLMWVAAGQSFVYLLNDNSIQKSGTK